MNQIFVLVIFVSKIWHSRWTANITFKKLIFNPLNGSNIRCVNCQLNFAITPILRIHSINHKHWLFCYYFTIKFITVFWFCIWVISCQLNRNKSPLLLIFSILLYGMMNKITFVLYYIKPYLINYIFYSILWQITTCRYTISIYQQISRIQIIIRYRIHTNLTLRFGEILYYTSRKRRWIRNK